MRMGFSTGDRCLASCWSGANPVAANWPDTPRDLKCARPPCNTNVAPSFWTAKRLTGVTTKVWDGSAYRDVDDWAFTHQYPPTNDGTSPSLWLASITHTGKVGGSKALPTITFGGTAYANRMDYNVSAGVPQTNKYRVTRLSNGTGGEIRVTYLSTNCPARGNRPRGWGRAGTRLPADNLGQDHRPGSVGGRGFTARPG
ncbi:hypothetical protein ACFPIJ_29025 [Dactylosporangium cerinum]|uniref:Uncharacterized protein n=1 Tax=Dactylosporangium cerinum TaxID=1434730 RepID=A0ABV9W2D5_9ACTN